MSSKRMSRGGKNVPSYLLHRPTGQAYCRVRQPDGNRRHVYLGPYDSPESRRRYRGILADLDALQAGAPAEPPQESETDIAELVARFLLWAEPYYCKPDGTPTREFPNIRMAVRPLLRLYQDELVQDFTPGKLRRTRDEMVAIGWCRNFINKQVRRLRLMVRWGVERELVPVHVHQALQTVTGLRKGRSEARESEPVKPAPWGDVERALPFLKSQTRA